MRIIQSLDEMTETARGWLAGGTVGFVPIKKEVHQGHQTLIQAAHRRCEICVVSIMARALHVEEGLYHPPALYTGEPEHVLLQLQEAGADIVFIPRREELFPPDFSTYITPTGHLVERLIEVSDPVRIRELVTAVTKLFQLVRPDITYFGQKDAQYIAIIRKLIRDLHIDISLAILPTIREHDGLAMSIRNHKLSPEERQAAPILYQALLRGKALIEEGERQAPLILQAIADVVATEPLITLEYVALCDPETFVNIQEVMPGTIIAIAAQAGTVHLIDNIVWMKDQHWRL